MAKIPGNKPQYLKVYENIRKQIMVGKYHHGDLLPSESDMQYSYKVTQPVIRQALSLLVNEGLIYKHQGKGSVVQQRPTGVGILTIQGKDLTSQFNNPEISTRISKVPHICDWPEKMLFPLNDSEKSMSCISFERIRFAAGEPMFKECFFIPSKTMEKLVNADLTDVSFYQFLKSEFNLYTTGSIQKFWAVKADANNARILKVSLNSPLIQLERCFTTNKQVNIYSSLIANTEKYILYAQS